MFATVVFLSAFPEPLTYSVPQHLRGVVREGSRVVVPLGRSKSFGVVVELRTQADLPRDVAIRDIEDCLDATPLVGHDLLTLARWVASYYAASWGEVLKAALPAGLVHNARQIVKTTGKGTPDETELVVPAVRRLWDAMSARGADVYALTAKHRGVPVRSYLANWSRLGLVEFSTTFSRRTPELTAKWLRLSPHLRDDALSETIREIKHKAPAQAQVLERLRASGPTPRSVVLGVWGAGASAIDSLVGRRLVEQFTQPLSRDPLAGWPVPPVRPYELTDLQRAAVDRIVSQAVLGSYATFLLDGVAGSGKTDVYLETAQSVLRRGKTVLMLVPEIALAIQTVLRFRARFGSRVALLHSGLSDGERVDTWRRVVEGRHDVVVGARSAVFAPLKRCGLVIVDEEHSDSYKQSESPRYNARDVAVIRAKQEAAVCVLGSATPSLESIENTRRDKYVHVKLPTPAPGLVKPEVVVVDMRAEAQAGNRTALSRTLVQSLGEVRKRDEQAILLLNRRGYARVVRCSECGYAIQCPDCAVALTYHQDGTARCHYCGHADRPPTTCPACGSSPLQKIGTGTQKAKDQLERFNLKLRVARMDRDSTGRKGAHRDLLDAFGSGEYDVLVGTQMVAKGLDFPKVTLVGVLRADDGLDFPDFRARERTFQLLSQVAGRAGRSEAGGRVVIQTNSPDHNVVVAAATGKRDEFYNDELETRRKYGYPPYTHLVLVTATGSSASLARKAVSRALKLMEEESVRLAMRGVVFLGPASAPVPYLKRRYREQVLVKTLSAKDANLIVSALRADPSVAGSRLVALSIDVDPHDFM